MGSPLHLGSGWWRSGRPRFKLGARAGVGTVTVIGAEAEAAEKPLVLEPLDDDTAEFIGVD